MSKAEAERWCCQECGQRFDTDIEEFHYWSTGAPDYKAIKCGPIVLVEEDDDD